MNRETIKEQNKATEPGLMRDRFPLLQKKTYLSNHTLGAVPEKTQQSLQDYYDVWNEEGIVAWEGEWWEMVEQFSSLVSDLLNAPEETIVPLQNVTRGMAGVASCFAYEEPRNQIVMTDVEFVTSYAFWNRLQELGAETVIVESEDGVTVDPEKMKEAITDRTLLVATSHAFFQSGAMQELKPVVEHAHDMGAMVLGDGYQVIGIVPVDVRDLNVDFYVGGSHKWLCGGPGGGFLYVQKDRLDEVHPRLTGWFGLQNPFGFDVEPHETGEQHEGAYRFFSGTPNVPGLYGAMEGVRIVNEIGVDRINRISRQMTQEMIRRANAEGFDVTTPEDPDRRNGMVCMDFPGSGDVREKLIERDVIVDWRPDCGIRASAHFYNNFDDVDRFWNQLLEARDEVQS